MGNTEQKTAVEVGHETDDVRIKPIMMFGIGLVVSAVVVYLIVGGLFSFLEKREEREAPKPSPLAAERQVIPPEPRLQLAPGNEGQKAPDLEKDHPLEEGRRVKQEERDKLQGYAWIDQKAGTVRIPIEQAKILLLQRGLPTRAPANGQSAPGGPASAPANSDVQGTPEPGGAGHRVPPGPPGAAGGAPAGKAGGGRR